MIPLRVLSSTPSEYQSPELGVLHHILLLYYIMPYYTILHHVMPYYSILYHIVTGYSILYQIIPGYSILYHTIPYQELGDLLVGSSLGVWVVGSSFWDPGLMPGPLAILPNRPVGGCARYCKGLKNYQYCGPISLSSWSIKLFECSPK